MNKIGLYVGKNKFAVSVSCVLITLAILMFSLNKYSLIYLHSNWKHGSQIEINGHEIRISEGFYLTDKLYENGRNIYHKSFGGRAFFLENESVFDFSMLEKRGVAKNNYKNGLCEIYEFVKDPKAFYIVFSQKVMVSTLDFKMNEGDFLCSMIEIL